MKILVLGPMFPDSFAENISMTLEEMGHTVLKEDKGTFARMRMQILRITSHAKKWLPDIENYFFSDLIKFIEVNKPELILNSGMQIPPRVVDQMRCASEAPVFLWSPDHMVTLDRQYHMSARYDACFLKDPHLVKIFRHKLAKPAYYLPEACNPLMHNRVKLTQDDIKRYACDLTIAGTLYYYRAVICEHFIDYDFKIWGSNPVAWLDSPVRRLCQHRYVVNEEKAKAFNAAKIVLNVMHYGEVDGVNARTFEAAGCGAFQITDNKSGLRKLFVPDKEIVTFDTLDELKDKVAYYAAHEKERCQIAARGYERAHREHTYAQRLACLLDIANGNQKKYPYSND